MYLWYVINVMQIWYFSLCGRDMCCFMWWCEYYSWWCLISCNVFWWFIFVHCVSQNAFKYHWCWYLVQYQHHVISKFLLWKHNSSLFVVSLTFTFGPPLTAISRHLGWSNALRFVHLSWLLLHLFIWLQDDKTNPIWVREKEFIDWYTCHL